MSKKLLVALCGLFVALLAAPAQAAIDDIVVTSERVDGTLQETPIAVTALDRSELEKKQITAPQDLQKYTPSLNMFNNITQPTNLSLSLRGGLQQDASLVTAESPVGFYVDGIYLGRLNGNNIKLSDLERVEVLRGPQGTLYGRNTGYGAVRYITRVPDEEGWLDGSIGAGTDEQFVLDGSVGGQIADNWFGSFSGQFNEKDGQYFNVATDEAVGLEKNYAFRGKLRFTGLDNTDATLSLSYTDSENDSNQLQSAGLVAGAAPQFTTEQLDFEFGEWQVGTPAAQLGPFPLRDRPQGETQQTILGLTVTHDISSSMEFRSTTGLVNTDDFFQTDFSGNGGGFTTGSDISSDQFTQEFNLVGTAFDDQLSYIAGVYYFTEDNTQSFGWNLGGAPISATWMNATTDALAIFGEGTISLTDRWSVNGGLRFTTEDKDIEFLFDAGGAGNPAPVVRPDIETDEVTWKVGTDFLLGDVGPIENGLIYGKVATGFKGAGYSAIVIFGPGELQPYDVETNTTYEIGFKADWFGSILRTNLAAFYMDIEDVQQNVTGAGGTFPVQNSGDQEVQGLEFEISLVPIEGLNIFFNGAVLDGEYKNLIDGSGARNAELNFANVSEAMPPQLPDLTYVIGFDYTFDFPGDLIGDVSFGADYYDIDNYVTAATNDFNNSGWDELGAFISAEVGENTTVKLSGTNLTDEYNITSGSLLLGGFIANPPRQVLLSVLYRSN